MATIVLAHGAWSAAWAWKKMRPLMAEAGHTFVAPTYTGLGERAHLATPAIDLETHIADVLGVIEAEDLHDVVLLAHSYGGMVATGVADRATARIRQIVYLDAFVPRAGQSLGDLVGPVAFRAMCEKAAAGDGWRVPPQPVPADTSADDCAWVTRHRLPMPLKCFEQTLELRNGETGLPRCYIQATGNTSGQFTQFAEHARAESGWRSYEIDASHSPNVTAPEQLMTLLNIAIGET